MTNRQPRTGPLVFGLLLVGLGGTAALAAQTGLSVVQAASIMLFSCTAVLLSILLDRTRSNGSMGPGPSRG